jgi:hypothetical protein
MKYVKMLGLLAVAAAALMAFAGTASATLTEGAGDPVDNGDILHASAEGNTSLTGTLTVTCEDSTVTGEVTTNDANEASGPIGEEELSFENCGNDTVAVLTEGTLKVTDTGTGTGTLSSNGAEVTILTHRPFVGTVHCIYKTTNTDLGTVTGGTPATLNIASISLERVTTAFGCGTHSTWEGNYEVNTPGTLLID